MQKITDNVYVETEFPGSNDGFVVTTEGVVMIDTPHMPTDAVKWRDEINKHGEVRYLINTEPHGDHITGNCFFGGTVVAHEGTREAVLAASAEELKERLKEVAPDNLPLMEGFSFRPPTITFSHRLTLYVGKHTFQLINFPGHTPFEVAVYIPEERVLFTTDNVFYRMAAFLHESVPYEWLDSLKRMQGIEADVLVPGHGDVCDPSYLAVMGDRIQAWIDAVTGAIDKGMSLKEAQDNISFLDQFAQLKTEPMMSEAMIREVQRMNVARLYEVLRTSN
jgi:cyclase